MIHTTFTPAVLPPKQADDWEQRYAISVAKHYNGNIPSFAEIAKAESKRMWAEAGHKQTWDVYAKAQAAAAMRPNAKPAVKKLTPNKARAAEAHAAVMGALISGMTSSDVARVAKMTKERALRTLRRLEAAGIVYRTDNRTTQCAHWWREK